MKLERMYHTGFVVSDMERSLAFYNGVLGLKEERNSIIEGDWISTVLGYPNARIHIVYLGLGDGRHSLELIQYLAPKGKKVAPIDRKDVGATHLGILVEDLEAFYRDLTAKGVKFVNPPKLRKEAVYPWARKACYLQDPDGNWLEFVERAQAP